MEVVEHSCTSHWWASFSSWSTLGRCPLLAHHQADQAALAWRMHPLNPVHPSVTLTTQGSYFFQLRFFAFIHTPLGE